MSNIHIVCPQCDARFQGARELMHTSLKCEDCDHEFEVTEKTIDKLASRYFPGERAKDLDAFVKQSPDLEHQDDIAFSTATYVPVVDPNDTLPLGPRRLLAITTGFTVILGVLALFLLGSGERGWLTEVDNEKRWVLAMFTSVIGGLLIIFGFRKYRLIGILLAVVMAAALTSMPILYPFQPLERVSIKDINASLPVESPEEVLERYKRELGYYIVEERISESVKPDQILAIALIDAELYYLDTIKQYLMRRLNLERFPRSYTGRKLGGEEAVLVVCQGVSGEFSTIASNIEELGEVRDQHADLRVIEIEVDRSKLQYSDTNALKNADSVEYYKANLAELKSLSEERQLQALQRLAVVEKTMLRADVVGQLKKMLQDSAGVKKAEVVNTLRRWSVEEDGIAEIVIQQATIMLENGEEVPMSYLWFFSEHPNPENAELLVNLWKLDVFKYETVLILTGSLVEDVLIKQLATFDESLLKSAARILKKIGTKKSIPALLTVHETTSGDLKKSLKATIDEIESRE